MQDQCTPPPEVKTCSRCGASKPIEAFGSSHGQPRRSCHDCEREAARLYRLQHPGASARNTQKWRDLHPERAREVTRKSLAKHAKKRLAHHRAWYAKNRERMADYSRRYYAEHRAQARKKAQQWNTRNPERARISKQATDKVLKAIKRGRLARPTSCEQCGKTAKIEAAHHDYSRPLDVRWLCITCHRRWDSAEPKTLH